MPTLVASAGVNEHGHGLHPVSSWESSKASVIRGLCIFPWFVWSFSPAAALPTSWLFLLLMNYSQKEPCPQIPKKLTSTEDVPMCKTPRGSKIIFLGYLFLATDLCGRECSSLIQLRDRILLSFPYQGTSSSQRVCSLKNSVGFEINFWRQQFNVCGFYWFNPSLFSNSLK